MFKVGDKVVPSEIYKKRYCDVSLNPRDRIGKITEITQYGVICVDWGSIANTYSEDELTLHEPCTVADVHGYGKSSGDCKFNIGDIVRLFNFKDVGIVQDYRQEKEGAWQIQVRWENTQPTLTGWYYEQNITLIGGHDVIPSNNSINNNLNTDNYEIFSRITPTISIRSAPRGISLCCTGKEIRVGN